MDDETDNYGRVAAADHRPASPALLSTLLFALFGILMAETAPQQAASAGPAVIAYVIARAIEKLLLILP